MAEFKALLFGYSYALLAAPASPLLRAGFKVNLLCPHHPNIHSNHLTLMTVPKDLLVNKAAELASSNQYNLVVIGDDYCMDDVLSSDIPTELKLKLLPVASSDNFRHLFSKCILSEILLAAHISTPEFVICHSRDELYDGARLIKFPLFIKVDKSGGGNGVYECNSIKDILDKAENLLYPLLLQKKVDGNIVDLTAFYQNGHLIYFTYSIFHKTVGGPFGASSVRIYTQLGHIPEDVFIEMRKLGIALGADGFINVTCIECLLTGKRYFIEADARPNVWVDHSKYIGNDASVAIKQYFLNGERLCYPQEINLDFPASKFICYVDRLSTWDLVFNRYSAWNSFDTGRDAYLYILNRVGYRPHFLRRLCKSLLYQSDLSLRIFCVRHLKKYIPQPYWQKTRDFYRKIFHIKI